MKQPPQQETHYGQRVWVNQTTERQRREECLCLNCARLKPGQPDNCPVAQAFYKACLAGEAALMVTRCRNWEPPE